MLKKGSRFLIVATIELVIPVLVIFFLAPYVLDSANQLMAMNKTLEKTRMLSLMIRLLLYVAIFIAWPHVITRWHKGFTGAQIKKTRLTLLGAMLSIELLYWVGQL